MQSTAVKPRKGRTAAITLLLCCGAVLAADDVLPDADFLEYLGMWEESDEEWLVFEDEDSLLVDAEEPQERDDDASMELNDEG